MQYATELKASQVGHDLTRGRASFSRSSTSPDPVVEADRDDAELASVG